MPNLTIYNLTLCPLQSRLQHIYHGEPYTRVDLNPMPEPTLAPQSGTLDFANVQYAEGFNFWNMGFERKVTNRGKQILLAKC